MRNLLLLTSAFILTCPNLIAQNPDTLRPEWVIYQPSEVSNGASEGWGFDLHENGNLYWGVNATTADAFNFLDMLIIQVDTADGNVFSKDTIVFEDFNDQSYNLKIKDGKVYIGGRTCTSLGLNKCKSYLAKYDPQTREVNWEKRSTRNEGYNEVDGIAFSDQEIFIGGWSKANATDIDLFLMKLDENGNATDSAYFTSPGNFDEHQDGQMAVDDSMIYVTGLWKGSFSQVFQKPYDGRTLIAKFRKNDLSLADSVIIGRDDGWINAENGLSLVSDGEYLYVTGYTTPEENNWDVFITKYDKDLNRQWYTTWGYDNTESSRSIAVSPGGEIFMAATTQSFGNDSMDLMLLKFDQEGNLLWEKKWGGPGDDNFLDIHLFGSDLYISGRSNSFHTNGKNEAVLMKVNVEVSAPSSVASLRQKNKVVLYPNPTSGLIQLSGLDTEIDQLKVFSLDGSLIKMKKNADKTIDLQALNPGIYLLEFQMRDGSVIQKKIAVH